MDSAKVFCPNPDCPARGQTGKGNITVHSLKKKRYYCKQCSKTFTESKGTPFYRLRTPLESVVLVLKLLSHGCPIQAIVFAFDIDERTVASWLERGGQHCQEVHQYLVEKPRELGEVQMDEIRVKMLNRVIGWMAMAIEVPTRLWLGGVIDAARNESLIGRLVHQVKRCASALGAGLLFVTDGLRIYPTQIKEIFREPFSNGNRGRPQLIEWPKLNIVQVIKRYINYRLDHIERRIVQGSADVIDSLRHKVEGGGVLNTAFIERFNSTFRTHISALCRRTRAAATHCETLHCAMYLTGTVYNFCCKHSSLKMQGLIGGHKWLERTPAEAAKLADHCWRMEELLNFHVPSTQWTPIKKRGRPSKVLKKLIDQ